MNRKRLLYAVASGVLLLCEIVIALFVHDDFIRPYGGDILVTALLCCLVRILLTDRCRWLPLWIFLFSVAVEIGQYFRLVDLLGLGDIAFFRTLIGTSFAFMDIVCYAAGCAAFWIIERVWRGPSLGQRVN